MKRTRRKLLNYFSLVLLAIAIYLNFFYKEKNTLPKTKEQVSLNSGIK